MRTSRLTSFTAGAICMLVLGSGTAVAATGGKLIIGRANYATTTTSISNSKGTALSLKAPANRAALAVSNAVKVTNLNADKLDGVSSESFARTTGGTNFYDALGELDLAGSETNPSGSDIWVAYAGCPAGSHVSGGGFRDDTASGVVVESGPGSDQDGDYWYSVVAVDPTASDPSDSIGAYAVCWNPTEVPADQSVQRTSRAEIGSVLTPRMLRSAEAKTAN